MLLGIFGKKVANAYSESVELELIHYAESVERTYSLFTGYFTQSERLENAIQAIEMLDGYTPKTHRTISKKDMENTIKYLSKKI